jgi:hypothetical protein
MRCNPRCKIVGSIVSARITLLRKKATKKVAGATAMKMELAAQRHHQLQRHRQHLLAQRVLLRRGAAPRATRCVAKSREL